MRLFSTFSFTHGRYTTGRPFFTKELPYFQETEREDSRKIQAPENLQT